MIPGEDERVDVTEGLHQQLNTAMANLPGATRSAINNVVYHLVSYICRTPWCLPGGFWLASSTQHMSVPGVFRCAPSACALAFGVPKFSASCVFQRGIRVCHPARPAVAVDRRAACNFQTRQARSMCVWAAATEATPQVDETSAADSVKEFEDELDAIAAGVDDEEAPLEEPSSPRRLRYHPCCISVLHSRCTTCGVSQVSGGACRPPLTGLSHPPLPSTWKYRMCPFLYGFPAQWRCFATLGYVSCTPKPFAAFLALHDGRRLLQPGSLSVQQYPTLAGLHVYLGMISLTLPMPSATMIDNTLPNMCDNQRPQRCLLM